MANRSWTEIDLDAYAHNLDEIRRYVRPGQSVLQIVKADAYGHGAYEIACRAQQQGVVMLGVANAEEGAILRYRGVELPILVLSPSLVDEVDLLRRYRLAPTVSDMTFARAWSAAGEPGPVHVNIDTGMGRSGVDYRSAADFLRQLAALPGVVIEGVFSHYSAAENDPDFTLAQLERFEQLLAALPHRPRWVHIANSPGVVNQPDDISNLVRLGLLSYGIYPDPSLKSKLALRPVMTFKSTVGMVKHVRAGESLGYNRTYVAAHDHDYAILPVGYADGYDFLLSNRGRVLIGNDLCPVLGKISMDKTAVGLPQGHAVRPGDEATVLGGGRDELRAENLAALYGGSSYELLCQIGRRARRYYRQNGEIVSQAPLARREFHAPDFSDDNLNRIIEASIGQRLQSKEIAGLLYDNVLRHFFADHDRDVHYRRDFRHTITFAVDPAQPDYWLTTTTLTFCKQLQADYFLVACANSPDLLERYFARRDCEYRWLLDDNFALAEEWFAVTDVQVNGVSLSHDHALKDGCIEIRCAHPGLAALVGREVEFSIATRTYYPRRSHQMAVYITELTQGVAVRFVHPPQIERVEVITVFSGRTRFPGVADEPGLRRVFTAPDEWVFPNSGVVFAY